MRIIRQTGRAGLPTFCSAAINWIGYTYYQSAWKPRLAFNLDYASGCAGLVAQGDSVVYTLLTFALHHHPSF